jgi:hypothetical protein
MAKAEPGLRWWASRRADADDEVGAAGDVHHAALADLLVTRPTTPQGCAALRRGYGGQRHRHFR